LAHVAQLDRILRGSAGRPVLFPHHEDAAPLHASFQPGDFLVFGRETKGLPESLLKEHADACLTIPIGNPQVRSLNLATAAAIVLFEALRQNAV
jgi:tRNA (cytidine/uridine-2'-O-)-methyltransferase